MSGFTITVTEARESKEDSYQDAFMRVECSNPECGHVLGPIYRVRATYSSPIKEGWGETSLLEAFVTAEAIGPAVEQGVQLFRILSPMIDAAEADFNQRKAAEEAEAEAEATETKAS